MSGPKKIIELDGTPRSQWRLESSALHLFRGRLWSWEIAGCVVCCGALDNAENQTLCRVDDGDTEHFYCLEHQDLQKLAYVITRKCTVRIGEVEREFTDVEEDFLLFPAVMDAEACDALTNTLIAEAQQQARDQDWLPLGDE